MDSSAVNSSGEVEMLARRPRCEEEERRVLNADWRSEEALLC